VRLGGLPSLDRADSRERIFLRLGDNDALGADSLQPWEARQCRTKSWRVRHSAPFLALRDAALAAAGISTQDASEYERLANVPQEDFETALADPYGPRSARGIGPIT
jgi:hypothetical protein